MSSFGVTAILMLLFQSFHEVQNGRVKRVINGEEVNCGSQPHIVSLRNSSNGQHMCGAVILSPDFALTAAHCVRAPPQEYSLQLNNLCGPPAQATVKNIIIHNQYHSVRLEHDIALMRIKLNVDDTTWLRNTSLPKSSIGLSGECITYGYGYRVRQVKNISDKLLAGPMRIISLDECLKALGPYVAPKAAGGMLCALGDGVDACEGDSGGPLVCNGVVEAISSYGMDCGIPGLPGVFTSVAAHRIWIERQMAKPG